MNGMFKEQLNNPLYDIDLDVPEQLFLDWDEDMYPTCERYYQSLPLERKSYGKIKVNDYTIINPNLIKFPQIETDDNLENGLNIESFLDLSSQQELSKSSNTHDIGVSSFMASTIPISNCDCSSSNTCSLCIERYQAFEDSSDSPVLPLSRCECSPYQS